MSSELGKPKNSPPNSFFAPSGVEDEPTWTNSSPASPQTSSHMSKSSGCGTSPTPTPSPTPSHSHPPRPSLTTLPTSLIMSLCCFGDEVLPPPAGDTGKTTTTPPRTSRTSLASGDRKESAHSGAAVMRSSHMGTVAV